MKETTQETTLTRLFIFMVQNEYFIGNDLLAKYKELKDEEEKAGGPELYSQIWEEGS